MHLLEDAVGWLRRAVQQDGGVGRAVAVHVTAGRRPDPDVVVVVVRGSAAVGENVRAAVDDGGGEAPGNDAVTGHRVRRVQPVHGRRRRRLRSTGPLPGGAPGQHEAGQDDARAGTRCRALSGTPRSGHRRSPRPRRTGRNGLRRGSESPTGWPPRAEAERLVRRGARADASRRRVTPDREGPGAHPEPRRPLNGRGRRRRPGAREESGARPGRRRCHRRFDRRCMHARGAARAHPGPAPRRPA